ncbi:replication factor C subunit 4 [Phakopsora pachyrhizi]|nr:replication factor C subunit 4 [Phakopsora pachyrhizi]
MKKNSTIIEDRRVLYNITGNDETINCLKVIARDGKCPHIIISGLPGIGKTTSILCLAHALLGESHKDAVLELNASDKRGKGVVRNKIKTFANTKIIEGIGSQCAILKYSKLSDQHVLKRLIEISEAEKVRYLDDTLSAMIFISEGDMRQAINNLQSNHSGFGFISSKILLACEKGNISNCLNQLDQLWSQGYRALDIVTTFMKANKTMDKMAEYLKLEFIKEIGFTHMQILEGVSTLTQLGGLMSRLCKLKINPKSFNV